MAVAGTRKFSLFIQATGTPTFIVFAIRFPKMFIATLDTGTVADALVLTETVFV
jgi:hypothetical protein